MKRALRYVLPAYLLIEGLVTLTVASWLGPGPTLLLLVIGVAAGVAVLRAEQFSLVSRLRQVLASGNPLISGLLDGILHGVAGVLLIVPGLISDLAAVGLLIPRLRQRLIRRLSAALGDEPAGPVVIEGDYRRVDLPALPAAKRGP